MTFAEAKMEAPSTAKPKRRRAPAKAVDKAVTQTAPKRRKMWDPAEARLTCLGVVDETADVKTFRLAPEDGSRIKFHAGQNLTLEWTMPDGEVVHRTFTIASAPTCAGHVEITMKAQATGGHATRDMHARLTEGMTLRAYGPGGRFGLAYHPADKVLLVGAGSGATPMMSMLRWVRDRGYETDIVYLHAARTPTDALFLTELAEIDAAMANVSVQVIVTRVPEGQSWFGPRGYLNRRMLNALVPDARDREVFCCGPEPFMHAVQRALRASGHDPARYHDESFGGASLAPPVVAADTPEAGWTLRLAKSGRTAKLDPTRTVFQNLKSAGLVVPTGCQSGICGTCRVRKLEGSVAMQHQGGISPDQEAAGDILACCSYAVGDLALDV